MSDSPGMNQGLSAAHRKWVEVIERQRAGGLSVAAFCRKNGIAASSFFVWKRRIISSPVAPVFVEAKVFEPLPAVRGAGVLEIRLRGRRRVRVWRESFDRGLLADVVAVLEGLA